MQIADGMLAAAGDPDSADSQALLTQVRDSLTGLPNVVDRAQVMAALIASAEEAAASKLAAAVMANVGRPNMTASIKVPDPEETNEMSQTCSCKSRKGAGL